VFCLAGSDDQAELPSSPADEKAYGAHAQVTFIKHELSEDSCFPTGGKPTERSTPMEAALIALALLWHSKSSDEIDLPRWISMVLKEDLSYGTTGWLQPPSMGDWQRPDGHIHTAVKSIDTDVANCMVYGTALQRWGNLIKPPPVGSLKKWFHMFGELEITRQKKNVKRAPFICLEAARLLHHMLGEGGRKTHA
jgi:hypothetical protein